MDIFDRKKLERISSGDAEAFKSLFDHLYMELVARATFYVIDKAAAEDIVQDSLSSVWNNRRQLTSIENLEGYMLRQIKNRCINYLKHLKVANHYRRSHMISEITEVETPPEIYYKAIEKLIDRMPPKRREVFLLSVYQSKSYAEIAALTNISVNTVKEHIKAAYFYLRKESSHIPYP